MKQTKQQAKQEVMNFKSTLKKWWVYYKNPNADKVDWNAHDDEMFDYYYDLYKPVRVCDCSFADCTHFFFDLGDKGIVDFVLDGFNKHFDIWKESTFFPRNR